MRARWLGTPPALVLVLASRWVVEMTGISQTHPLRGLRVVVAKAQGEGGGLKKKCGHGASSLLICDDGEFRNKTNTAHDTKKVFVVLTKLFVWEASDLARSR